MGKKVKSVRWQKSTGRVVVDFYGKDNVVIKKVQAVKDGLFKPDPEIIKPSAYAPLKPVDIFIDSPLYIGIVNNFKLYGPDLSDIIIPQKRVSIQNAGTENNYTATATIPGKAELLFIDSTTGKVKYIAHALVKRLPGDGPDTEPEVRLGNITTVTTSATFLKQQNEIVVSDGFTLAGGMVFFTGTGFRDIIVADLDKVLTYTKPYIDLCMPGSQILFDDITVRDASGKIFSSNNFAIKVIDAALSDNAGADYYSLSTFPQFLYGERSLETYLKDYVAAAGINATGQRVSFVLKVEANGSISPISDAELAGFTPFERKCFDIIKNGPVWTPGSYKGENVAMTVTFYCEF